MNINVTKEFKFDCAHMLMNHTGLCRNLHGHTYKLEVTVESSIAQRPLCTAGSKEGMVLDFKDLKEVVKKLIVEEMDHATIICSDSVDPFELELLELLRKHDRKYVEVPYRPTAESMSIDFMNRLVKHCYKKNLAWKPVRIRLYETPTSYAEVV